MNRKFTCLAQSQDVLAIVLNDYTSFYGVYTQYFVEDEREIPTSFSRASHIFQILHHITQQLSVTLIECSLRE